MFLTLLFARLAVLCYLARFPLEAAGKTLAAKVVWTAGAALLAIHTVVAIVLVHAGSHAAAVEATAERTREAFGVDAGYGVWFNYACVLVWSADALRLSLSGSGSLARRDAWFWFVQTYLAFMIFFGAVVFGSLWWLLPIGASVVATIVYRRERRLS
ncbi:MAG TPA: hypothetical protein VGN57_17045 [Pirellulaceae bacterium]|nr:hypothetical protein [Pirellulaceae bacterium]